MGNTALLLESEINKLLKKQVVKKQVIHEVKPILSPVFLVGGQRLVINLKNLNNLIKYQHFKI